MTVEGDHLAAVWQRAHDGALAARLEYERDTAEDAEDRDPRCESPGAPGYGNMAEPEEEKGA